jgi:hypothetical protein
MENWLQNRLSPVKIDTDRWTELAAAIEEYWEENFDPELAWIVALRSIYEADIEGQRLIQAEKGQYFEDNIPTENIPLAVQQKELELCQKGSCYPFEHTLKRLGLTAEWVAIHANRVSEYGTDFRLADNILEGWRLDGSWVVSDDGTAKLRAGYFLTSRGVLRVELENDSIADEIALIRNRIAQTRPVWIVFDGIVYLVIAELIQNHSMEASGYLRAEAMLSGWNCGLKLDGTWGLGRAIRLDGQWCLNRGWRVGQTWPRGIIVNKLDGSRALDGTWQLDMVLLPHHKILDCRLETEGLIRIDAEMPLFRSRNYFQVAADSPVPLDGDYQLGRVFARWPDVTTDAISSFDRDVYFGGTASELPVDVVYCGLLSEGRFAEWVCFGGSSTELPDDVIDSGDADVMPILVLYRLLAFEVDDVIYSEMFRIIYLGGPVPMPVHEGDVWFGGTIGALPAHEIYCDSVPQPIAVTIHFGTPFILPDDIVFSGNAQYQADDVIDYGLLPRMWYFGGESDALPQHVILSGLDAMTIIMSIY